MQSSCCNFFKTCVYFAGSLATGPYGFSGPKHSSGDHCDLVWEAFPEFGHLGHWKYGGIEFWDRNHSDGIHKIVCYSTMKHWLGAVTKSIGTTRPVPATYTSASNIMSTLTNCTAVYERRGLPHVNYRGMRVEVRVVMSQYEFFTDESLVNRIANSYFTVDGLSRYMSMLAGSECCVTQHRIELRHLFAHARSCHYIWTQLLRSNQLQRRPFSNDVVPGGVLVLTLMAQMYGFGGVLWVNRAIKLLRRSPEAREVLVEVYARSLSALGIDISWALLDTVGAPSAAAAVPATGGFDEDHGCYEQDAAESDPVESIAAVPNVRGTVILNRQSTAFQRYFSVEEHMAVKPHVRDILVDIMANAEWGVDFGQGSVREFGFSTLNLRSKKGSIIASGFVSQLEGIARVFMRHPRMFSTATRWKRYIKCGTALDRGRHPYVITDDDLVQVNEVINSGLWYAVPMGKTLKKRARIGWNHFKCLKLRHLNSLTKTAHGMFLKIEVAIRVILRARLVGKPWRDLVYTVDDVDNQWHVVGRPSGGSPGHSRSASSDSSESETHQSAKDSTDQEDGSDDEFERLFS